MFATNSSTDGPVLNAGSATANANIVSFFPSHSASINQSHQAVAHTASSVILRSPDSVTDSSANSDYINPSYQLCSSASAGYQHYPPVQFPFLFGTSEWSFFQHPSALDPSCSPGQVSSQLASPIIPHTALASSLNPIQSGRLTSCAPRALPYNDYQASSGSNQMTGLGRSGGRSGRRARDNESVDEDPDEMEKKMKRRLRNKEAAARCRQRRLDLMGNLNDQVEKLQSDNDMKERILRQCQDQIAKITDLIESRRVDLPTEVFQQFRSIIENSAFPPVNCHMRNENRNLSLPNDYQPRGGLEQLGHRRPISHGPRESDINLLEPETKTPKLESDPTLGITVINQQQEEQTLRVSRPHQLGLDSAPTSTGIGISTPSNFTQSTTFPSNQFGGENFVFLHQPTGLTPSTIQPVGFVSQTPTLQTSSAELQMTNL